MVAILNEEKIDFIQSELDKKTMLTHVKFYQMRKHQPVVIGELIVNDQRTYNLFTTFLRNFNYYYAKVNHRWEKK